MFAWTGKILRVDLSSGKVSKEDLNREWAEEFIGARGLGSKYLFEEIDPQVDALSPDNELIFATGPLTGTYAVTGGRYNVITKSPLTGTIAASNSGGHFGPELKYAGYDMIIIEGKAKEPVYLWINDDKVEIRSAEEIWGKTTHEATDMILEETDEEAKVSCIGPAGEKLSFISCVINDKHRGAGRSGVGAVMGSKNLKAVAVRGTGGIKVADKDRFRETVLEITRDKIKTNETTSENLPKYGTAVMVNLINEEGVFPARNFQTGLFPTADNISGETLAETLLTRKKACFACPIACGRASRVVSGKYKGQGEGPEYETIWALGADCGVDNFEAVAKANYLCNELGLDPISLGSTIACAMELYEMGVITKKDTGGLEFEFGDPDVVIEAARLAGYREGFGDTLADGSYRLGEKYGHPELSISSKKQEFPAYDPRGIQGLGLNFATSNRGACHVRGYTVADEVLGDVDRFTTEGKAQLAIDSQNRTSAVDAAGICLFSTFAIDVEDICAMMSSATGLDWTVDSLLKAGERIWNLEKLFNLKAGLTKADDTLPPRMLEEEMPEGPSKGHVVGLEEMLTEYYKLRGWDEKGVPTEEKLKELNLVA